MNEEYFQHLWVAPTPAQQILGAAALFIIVGALVGVYLFEKRQRAVVSGWGRIAALAINRGLSPLDLDLLRQFYQQLSSSNRSALSRPDTFHSLLQDYLSSQAASQPEGSVELLATMFPAMKFKLGIDTLHDIVQGEVMALKLPAGNLLVHTREVTPDALLLSSAAVSPQEGLPRATGNLPRSESCELYCYRPEFGGFSLKGRVDRTPEAMVFSHLESVTRHRRDHLMAALPCSVRLTGKRPVYPKRQSPLARKPIRAESQIEEGIHYQDMLVTAVTEFVSDRAVLCAASQAARPGKLEESVKEWAVELKLPSGETLDARGRIMRSRLRDRFIVRLYGLSGEHRELLTAAIAAANPEPERFL